MITKEVVIPFYIISFLTKKTAMLHFYNLISSSFGGIMVILFVISLQHSPQETYPTGSSEPIVVSDTIPEPTIKSFIGSTSITTCNCVATVKLKVEYQCQRFNGHFDIWVNNKKAATIPASFGSESSWYKIAAHLNQSSMKVKVVPRGGPCTYVAKVKYY